MDKKGIARTLAGLSVLGLLAGATLTAGGCRSAGSCSSCTASLQSSQTQAQATLDAVEVDQAGG